MSEAVEQSIKITASQAALVQQAQQVVASDEAQLTALLSGIFAGHDVAIAARVRLVQTPDGFTLCYVVPDKG